MDLKNLDGIKIIQCTLQATNKFQNKFNFHLCNIKDISFKHYFMKIDQK